MFEMFYHKSRGNGNKKHWPITIYINGSLFDGVAESLNNTEQRKMASFENIISIGESLQGRFEKIIKL